MPRYHAAFLFGRRVIVRPDFQHLILPVLFLVLTKGGALEVIENLNVSEVV